MQRHVLSPLQRKIIFPKSSNELFCIIFPCTIFPKGTALYLPVLLENFYSFFKTQLRAYFSDKPSTLPADSSQTSE
jgi:hypothetical protein